jgi:hypothetical protein
MSSYIPEQDNSYPPALGPVLLLTCMDPRLLDNVVNFMNHDNLTNRYDHVILAGAALGALGGCQAEYEHWRKTFFDHLAGAHKLHAIEEVYIVEHRHCGAYHKIFKVCEEFGDSREQQLLEAECHMKYTDILTKEIKAWAKAHDTQLKVRAFLMDVRGQVSLMHHATQTELATTKRTKKRPTKR